MTFEKNMNLDIALSSAYFSLTNSHMQHEISV